MSNKFEFRYSVPTEEERNEIKNIRNQYLDNHSQNEKLARLRKLDAKVKNIPTCVSMIVGIMGILIFGLGLAMALEWGLIFWGVIIGVIGCVPMGFSYIVYNKTYLKLKDKYSDEILQISNELLNETDKNK